MPGTLGARSGFFRISDLRDKMGGTYDVDPGAPQRKTREIGASDEGTAFKRTGVALSE